MNSNTNDVPFHERHDDELLTLEDVAQILKMSENTVRWWRQTGTGPEFFKIGRRLYTTVGDLRRWRGPGRPTTSLKGLPAARLVRALADFVPPYSVADLADLAGASLGAAYRLSDYLVGEGLLTRTERGPITDVDWPELLRRWSQDARYLDTSTTRGFLEPRGLDSLVEKLGKQTPSQRYAVSGSLATQPYASYAEARLGLVYADDPPRLASDLGLRPVEAGANVILAAPRSPVVFERTSTWRDITIVAPSQAVADLLGGPGRNPAEGDYLLDWMKENPNAWRRQLDR